MKRLGMFRSIDLEAEGAVVATGGQSVLSVLERLIRLDLIEVAT
jgi:hypothetical protein